MEEPNLTPEHESIAVLFDFSEEIRNIIMYSKNYDEINAKRLKLFPVYAKIINKLYKE